MLLALIASIPIAFVLTLVYLLVSGTPVQVCGTAIVGGAIIVTSSVVLVSILDGLLSPQLQIALLVAASVMVMLQVVAALCRSLCIRAS